MSDKPNADIAGLTASLEAELTDILADMSQVLTRSGLADEPEPEPEPEPDEVTLPDEFELPEPPAGLVAAEPPEAPLLSDNFEAAAADICPAADYEPPEVEIEPDDFDLPLPDFKPEDWVEPPPPDPAPASVGAMTPAELTRLVEEAVTRGVLEALKKWGEGRGG